MDEQDIRLDYLIKTREVIKLSLSLLDEAIASEQREGLRVPSYIRLMVDIESLRSGGENFNSSIKHIFCRRNIL